MEKSYQLPDETYASPEAREAWIIEHAEYFTVVNRTSTERYEYPTLRMARFEAGARAIKNNKIYLLYAVYGPYSTFVTSVHPGGKNAKQNRVIDFPASA